MKLKQKKLKVERQNILRRSGIPLLCSSTKEEYTRGNFLTAFISPHLFRDCRSITLKRINKVNQAGLPRKIKLCGGINTVEWVKPVMVGRGGERCGGSRQVQRGTANLIPPVPNQMGLLANVDPYL